MMHILKKRKLNKPFPVIFVSRNILLWTMKEMEDFNILSDKEKENFVLKFSNKEIRDLVFTIDDAIGNNYDIDAYELYDASLKFFLEEHLKHSSYGFV